MILHRIDHIVRDHKGRKLRRVSRYVERRPSGAIASVVLEAPAAVRQPPVPAAERMPDEVAPPIAAAGPDPGELVDLADTDVVRGLRGELAAIRAQMAGLEVERTAVGGAARTPQAVAPAVRADLQTAEIVRAAAEELGRHGDRLAAIEAALGALGAAAEAAARTKTS